MRELHLFAGAGGGILGGYLLGHTCVCAVEIEPYPRKVLLQRQRDGMLPRFPIWDDVTTFDGTPWRGKVDVVCGGFPCQDISCAGSGEGISGKRSGLWGEMARVICEVRPRCVFVENSPALANRGLGRVLGDLAEMGYDARWCVLGYRDVGGAIARDRLWIYASPSGELRGNVHWRPSAQTRNMGRHVKAGSPVDWFLEGVDSERKQSEARGEGDLPPYLLRVADGLADGLDRIKAIGNGQVPAVAATAWRILTEGMDE